MSLRALGSVVKGRDSSLVDSVVLSSIPAIDVPGGVYRTSLKRGSGLGTRKGAEKTVVPGRGPILANGGEAYVPCPWLG